MHMERGLPYWTDEAALLPKMRPTARRNFHANLITCLISVYGTTRDRDALVRTADDYLAMLDAYYLDPEVVRRRPYIPKENVLSGLLLYDVHLAADRPPAGRRLLRPLPPFRGELLVADNMLLDRHWFYNISVSYYEHWGDYANAMVYNDSLILVSRPAGMSAQLADMYARRANLYERMGRYKEAGGAYREVIAVRDSLRRCNMRSAWANWKCSTGWTRSSATGAAAGPETP